MFRRYLPVSRPNGSVRPGGVGSRVSGRAAGGHVGGGGHDGPNEDDDVDYRVVLVLSPSSGPGGVYFSLVLVVVRDGRRVWWCVVVIVVRRGVHGIGPHIPVTRHDTLKKKNRGSFPIPILKTMHYVCFGLVFNQFKTVAAATRLH